MKINWEHNEQIKISVKAVTLGSEILAGETLRASASEDKDGSGWASLSVWANGKCIRTIEYKPCKDKTTALRLASSYLNKELKRRGY